jgi:hypothetical protein
MASRTLSPTSGKAALQAVQESDAKPRRSSFLSKTLGSAPSSPRSALSPTGRKPTLAVDVASPQPTKRASFMARSQANLSPRLSSTVSSPRGANDNSLHWACKEGDVAGVEELLASGAAIDGPDSTNECTPLQVRPVAPVHSLVACTQYAVFCIAITSS